VELWFAGIKRKFNDTLVEVMEKNYREDRYQRKTSYAQLRAEAIELAIQRTSAKATKRCFPMKTSKLSEFITA
jgi:hypothetical protein